MTASPLINSIYKECFTWDLHITQQPDTRRKMDYKI